MKQKWSVGQCKKQPNQCAFAIFGNIYVYLRPRLAKVGGNSSLGAIAVIVV
jgi:hypothetical protein